ncbi:hypothetical protein AGLY_007286 [Aphis glycines]|uniref:Glycoside hydrolase family 31 N-terminal domain-containing protein n=1 Tax=Aphis glycines TaxID=307491 RepID=A0A6G0TQD5_APHGL|nr:hypothetical protein AGLY_007286 [Aphis glycines]
MFYMFKHQMDIVLFLDNKSKLQVEHGKILEITNEKSLKLNFYEDCIDKDPSVCTPKTKGNENYLRYFSQSEKQECNNYEQVAQSMNDILQFCVNIGDSSWNGGSQVIFQYWPLNKFNRTDNPFITTSSGDQSVLESYFFNSNGYYIYCNYQSTLHYINESVLLFVDINGPRPGQMCFTAKVVAPYRKVRNFLQYQVCKYKNAQVAHKRAIKDILSMPSSIPDSYVIKYPIWSTWARYKVDVNTFSVRKFAKEIIDHGFPRGTFEIDDKWETCYGSAEFNTSRFENIKELTSLWTYPFLNLDCPCHEVAKTKGYLVKSTSNTTNVTWWNGDASYVDFTNPEAVVWWSNGLSNLLAKSGIDEGESSWSPQLPIFHDNDLTYYPDNIVNAYLKTISSFGNGIEYRAIRRSQEFGRLLRMNDRLPTLITALLQLNMIGYPFVLPDMIGGNGYFNSPPSKEMYIRWMQANVFMPVVQFSYTPWDFDQQTVDVCRKLMNLRANYTDTIIELMRGSVAKEYLLGENILVAPVIVEGATSRDVYLPFGLWRDENHPTSHLITGRKWLRNYPVKLDVLPWFTRVTLIFFILNVKIKIKSNFFFE